MASNTCPRCGRRHRHFKALATCSYPQAAWVIGSGPWALLAHCRELTITLHQTAEAAEAAKRVIDRTACGGACRSDHEIIHLELG